MHTLTRACTHTRMHAHTLAGMHTHSHVYKHTRTHTCTHTQTRTHTHVHIRIHTHTHMYTSSSWVHLALTRALGRTQAVAWVLFCSPRNCCRVGWPGPRLKPLGRVAAGRHGRKTGRQGAPGGPATLALEAVRVDRSDPTASSRVTRGCGGSVVRTSGGPTKRKNCWSSPATSWPPPS